MVRCWMSLAPCSFFVLVVFEREREIRLCYGVSWLVVSGTVFSWVGSEVSLFFVGFVVIPMVMDIFLGNVPFLLLLRSVKILSFMISLEWIRLIGHVAYSGMAGSLGC